MKINIAYTIQNEYIYMAVVSIQSILENNKNNDLIFYILYDKTIKNEYLEYFTFLNNYRNVKFKFVLVDQNKYVHINNYFKSIYCLELIDKIEEDKLIYCHSLSIINNDLTEIYNTDISDYACASSEFDMPLETSIKSKNPFIFSNYFILFNTKVCKDNKYHQKIISNNFLLNKDLEKKPTEIEAYNMLIQRCKKLSLKYGYAERWYIKNIKIIK